MAGPDHDTGYDLKYHGGQMQCRCEAEQERHCEGYRRYDQYARKRDIGHHKNRLVCVVGSFASMRLATLPERPIEVEGGAYECQVREGLGEVAQRLAAGSDLLGVEPEVVGVAEHLLEDKSSFF
jgi:hypothetical protein